MISECKRVRDFEKLVAASHDGPVFLLKHSTRCPISASRWRVYQGLAERESRAAFHRVLVIEDRPVSLHVAQASGIQHKSPQVILFYKGEPVWDASHYSITEEVIKSALESALAR